MKDKLRKLLPFIIALCAFLLFFIIGLNVEVPNRLLVAFYGFMAYDLLLVFNLITLFKQDYVDADIRIKKQREILGKKKDKAEKDLNAVVKKLRLILVLSWLQYSFAISLLLLFAFLLAQGGIAVVFFDLLIIYCLWSLIDMLFIEESSPLPENEIFENDFPELFNVIYEAAGIVGAGNNIRVFLQGSNISVLRYKKYDCILIGDIDMNYQTKEEMKQLLLHEFAHIHNENTVLTEKLMKAATRWQVSIGNPVLKVARIVMKTSEYFLQRGIIFFRLCASRVIEEEADKIVKRLGDRQAYVNGLAKSYAFGLYTEMLCPERDIYIYETEEATDKYGKTVLDLFYEYLDKHEPLWRRILDNELTPFIDSHPTFRMRREAMGIADYSFRTKETDEKYIEEQRHFLEIGDASRKTNIEENYKELREYRYVKRFKAIEEYEKNSDQTVQQLIETALYYEGANNDKAKEIFNTILEKDEDNAYAYFHLGRMLINDFNKEGISYIYKAMELNDGFTSDGLDLIGTFCIKAGLEEELLKYRENVVSIGQAAVDKSKIISGISSVDKLIPHDLPENVFDEILNFMLTTAAGKIDKIYLVKKVKGNIYSYIFMIKKAADVSDDDFSDLLFDIYRYLDLREEQFTLLEISDEKKMKWLIRRVKGCIVWSK